jgi:hypothetical protein
MIGKLSWVAAAFAVLALAAPSLASASQMTESGGGATPVGEHFEAFATNTSFVTSKLGTVTCSSLTGDNELTTNSGGTVAAEGLSTGFGFSCLLNSKSEVFVPHFELDEMNLTSTSSGSATLKAELLLPGSIVCNVSGTVAITYKSGSSTIHVSGSKLKDGPCGEVSVTDDFVLGSGLYVLD